MAYIPASGSATDTYSNSSFGQVGLFDLISRGTLEAGYAALGVTTATVIDTNGDKDLTFGANTIVVVSASAADASAISSAPIDANGGLELSGDHATYVQNSSGSPMYLAAGGQSDAIEYQGKGPVTIDGGSATTFFADTEVYHDRSPSFDVVTMIAASGKGAYSYMRGGSGPTTMIGSTNSLAKSVYVAGPGSTTMEGGTGLETMYGGGFTSMVGGTGPGDLMIEGNANSTDTIVGGTGGGDTMSLVNGNNVVDDHLGKGDFLNIGSAGVTGGVTTFTGGTGGTSIALFGNNDELDIKSTKGAENIFGSSTGTSIISFEGTNAPSVADLNAEKAGAVNNTMVVTFTSDDGGTQTATLNNLTHISFK